MPNAHGVRSERFLYERLTEKHFQRLCNALLVREFPGVACFPVGQKDGGRDALPKHQGRQEIVFQVKWSKDPVKNPVTWLDAAVRQAG